MITDQDVEKLKKTFVTKDEIKVLRKDIQKMSDDILQAVGEITKVRDPKTIEEFNNQQRQIDNHENRIIALELK